MELSLDLPFGLEFVFHCVLLFVVYKVLFIMLKRTNDETTWVQEFYYRQEIHLRHVRGIEVSPEFYDKWFMTEIWIVMVYIVALQQVLIIFTYMGILRWNSVLTQIYEFYQQNPNVSRPKFSNEVLESPNSNIIYFLDYLFINVGITGSLWAIDTKLENWYNIPAGKGAQLLDLVTIVFVAYSTITLLSGFVTGSTLGQAELELILEINGTKIFPLVKYGKDTI